MFIHSVSMRNMEMYFVFLLSTMSLSVHSEIGEVGKTFKEKLLLLHINDRPVPKLSNASAKILNDITQSINEYRENNVYCNYNYCYIVEKLEKNISDMTADDLFNALNVVCSNDSPDTDWANNMKKFATIMDFLLIEVKKDNIRSDQFFVAVYHPADYETVNIKMVVDDFNNIHSNIN